MFGVRDHAFELPWTPAFLHKQGGLFSPSASSTSGSVRSSWPAAWCRSGPARPSARRSFTAIAVTGLRLADQGVDKHGAPADGFMPGMDVRAQLTVVGDGPVGAVGQALDAQSRPARRSRATRLGSGHEVRHRTARRLDVEALQPGTVWHTFGYPEPEIFGFLYVHPDRLVSVGIFVPSWLGDPARTAYRYLQHYIQHPALWKYLKDGTLRSWGAKSLEESGRRGEPLPHRRRLRAHRRGLRLHQHAHRLRRRRGLDHRRATRRSRPRAAPRGHAVHPRKSRRTYEKRRRASWVEQGAREAENARNGFHRGIVRGMIGMALAGLTRGRLSPRRAHPARAQTDSPFLVTTQPTLSNAKMPRIWLSLDGRPLHDALLTARGWPEIPFDGRLLVTQQDALLMGGKVQAMPGFADHVVFRDLGLCIACEEKTCIAMCSGQAITQGADGLPAFEREKCVHCGACLWNCAQSPDGEHANIEFRAGSGGLHSAEN